MERGIPLCRARRTIIFGVARRSRRRKRTWLQRQQQHQRHRCSGHTVIVQGCALLCLPPPPSLSHSREAGIVRTQGVIWCTALRRHVVSGAWPTGPVPTRHPPPPPPPAPPPLTPAPQASHRVQCLLMELRTGVAMRSLALRFWTSGQPAALQTRDRCRYHVGSTGGAG